MKIRIKKKLRVKHRRLELKRRMHWKYVKVLDIENWLLYLISNNGNSLPWTLSCPVLPESACTTLPKWSKANFLRACLNGEPFTWGKRAAVSMTFKWIKCKARKSQSRECPISIVCGAINFRKLLCTSPIVVLTLSSISFVIPVYQSIIRKIRLCFFLQCSYKFRRVVKILNWMKKKNNENIRKWFSG